MKNNNFTFDRIQTFLKKEIPFSFSRWGNGEWACLLRIGKNNHDKHEYFSDLGQALADVLNEKPTYHLGMQNLATRLFGEKIQSFLELNKINGNWVNADIIHKATEQMKLPELFNLLNNLKKNKGTKILIVGANHIRQIDAKINYDHFVGIPAKNCWNKHQEINAKIKKFVDKHKGQSQIVILYCASMMANVLIHDIHKTYNNTITQIDIGSAFDPYCGRFERKYQQRIRELFEPDQSE